MMLSTPSSLKPVLENTCQDAYSSTWNPLLLTKSELEHTDNSSTLNNSSQEKKMLLTTSPEDITPLVKKLLISAWTESESWLTNAQDSKVSLSSTQSVEVPDLDLDRSSSKDSQSIMERNPNSVSLFTHHHKSQQPSLNPTTQFFPLTPFLNTLMLLLCWTMKQYMISAEEISILKDQPTPT
jgi:hypothetical protein